MFNFKVYGLQFEKVYHPENNVETVERQFPDQLMKLKNKSFFATQQSKIFAPERYQTFE